MKKIRLLHFSDLHIGMENYGRLDPKTGVSGRVLDFVQRFDALIEYGLERDVDLVIFAGDAFKTRDPNPTYQPLKGWVTVMKTSTPNAARFK